jgi:hypothetical protein
MLFHYRMNVLRCWVGFRSKIFMVLNQKTILLSASIIHRLVLNAMLLVACMVRLGPAT